MLATVLSSTLLGIDALLVEVEVDITGGLPRYSIVGLPEGAVKESKERIRSALRNSGYDAPNRRTTVNLAPADVRKEGSAFDLPIALGILAATGQLPAERLREYSILGELSLDGRVKPVRGALPIAASVREKKLAGVLLPPQNAREAAVVNDIQIIPIETLSEAARFLRSDLVIEPLRIDPNSILATDGHYDVDFAEVKGQEHVRRALEVAAAGGHNVIMVGPPGSGKTMLARRLPTVLPAMSLAESIETTRIHSVMGLMNGRPLVTTRPFRAPHHTISDAGMIGGGAIPRPGEISVAHNGVLFLDELPEFRRNVLEVLREPLEERRITISRASGSLTFPAGTMLVAAFNPWSCGALLQPATVVLTARKPKDFRYPTDPKTLGEHIRKARMDRRLLQREASYLMGVTEATVHSWELGHTAPKTELVARVYDFLGYCVWKPPATFGAWTLQVRWAMGLTDRKFAQLVGVDQSTLNGWETGRHKPQPALEQRIRTRFR